MTPLSTLLSIADDPDALVESLGIDEGILAEDLIDLDLWWLGTEAEVQAKDEMSAELSLSAGALVSVVEKSMTLSVQIATLMQAADTAIPSTTLGDVQSVQDRALMVTSSVVHQIESAWTEMASEGGSPSLSNPELVETILVETLIDTADEVATWIETRIESGEIDQDSLDADTWGAIVDLKNQSDLVAQSGLTEEAAGQISSIATTTADVNDQIAAAIESAGVDVIADTSSAEALSELVSDTLGAAADLVSGAIDAGQYAENTNVTEIVEQSGGLSWSISTLVDSDGDGTSDAFDDLPLNASEQVDTDADGIGNNTDTDDDGDGVGDLQEVNDGTDPLDRSDFVDRAEPLSGVVSDWKNQLPIADVIVSALGSDSESFSAKASGDPLGRYAFVDKYVGKNNLTFSKTTSSERLSRAISSLDALAALKMAVGINPNRDPDGDGPDEALAVSDYQRIAADMNADGAINSQDALAILKAAVGLGDIAPRWVFVPADHALSFEAGIDMSQFESIEIDYPATKKLNMIGVLVGDVDGSWEGPVVTDADGDGFFSFEDAFPDDPSEWLDTDGDGIGNNVDTDDDGDGVADANDGFPQISTGSLTDTDADGLPDDCDVACQATGLTADLDDDGDNVLDVNDALPLISLAGNLDTDQDGLPDECDTACLDLGLIADTDDDGDGALDYEDPFPLDAEVSVGRKAPSNLGLIE